MFLQLYRRIKTGEPGWAALQESQLDFLDNRIPAQDRSTLRGTLRGTGELADYRDYQHPFSWAAFAWMDRGQQQP